MTDRHWQGAELAVDTTEVRGLPVTRVAGEIDLAGVDLVRAELDVQLELRPPVLAVDLTDVTVLGSLGIAALLDAHDRAVAAGVRFAIVASHRSVVRPLQLTEVDRVLTVVPTLDQVMPG
ncbi:STAS domain-containing protein [Saccharothrix luteola]|uniref:STAS domain-containing protein n=1 Tax=Saccharothrix luteola TaxID=2893018 RepID=UPI001E3F0B22|nr:STAS domain-containing protein [Saccharothrix luteola]MCC8249552.1 STAS domain-containing protein [Saccharothrix luteola]